MKLDNKGQLILALILVMMVGLGIGLSVVQRSLVDVSTSSKVEQSSRAFSAAEAGIERALQLGSTTVNFNENLSKADVLDSGLIPRIPASNVRQSPLEYPPLSKEDIAQVWLADYTSTTPSTPPDCGPNIKCHYTQNTLDVYWGDSAIDKAALELTLVYFNGSQYVNRKWYLDQFIRSPSNSFEVGNCPASGFEVGEKIYRCMKTIGASPDSSLPSGLILIRARLLYNDASQPFAVWANKACAVPVPCSLPPQARVFISTGSSGETERRVKLFQVNKVVPPYFDYAIFSAGDIKK